MKLCQEGRDEEAIKRGEDIDRETDRASEI